MKTSKKLLSLFLAALMVFSLLPTMALADGPLPGAVNNVITLIEDVNLSGAKVVIPDGVTLDLNSKTLTGTVQAESGTVTIKNGKIVGRVNCYDAATLTIENGVEITGQIVVWGDGTKDQDGCKTPTLNMSGKISNTGDSAITTNGTDMSGAVINILAGAEVTSDDIAIYQPSGIVTVSGGTITGATAIYTKSGTTTISGGTIKGTGEKADYTYNGNGATATGDAFVVENCGYPNDAPSVFITGGEFVSANAAAVASYKNGENTAITGFITGGTFSDLASPIKYANEEGATIKLANDVTLSNMICVDKKVTLDLNGKTVSTTSPFDYTARGVLCVNYGGDLTVEDSTGNGKIESGDVYAAISLTNKGETQDGKANAKVTVNGGTIKGNYFGIATNGDRNNTKIVVNGGTVKGTYPNDNIGIFNPNNGEVTVNGGTIEGYSSAIEMRGGELSITGGTLTSTANTYKVEANGSGNTTVGAAIAIAQHTTKQNVTVNIAQGENKTVVLKGVKAVSIANPQNNNTTNVAVTLGAATYNGALEFSAGNNATLTINGGSFTDLATAVKYAAEGATITLFDNITIDSQLDINKAITLDGNNKTITRTPNTGDASTRAGILVTAGATIKDLIVSGPNTNASAWDTGEYGIKFVGGNGAKLTNVKVTGANAGILVHSSVTLEGNIDVSGNEFGGIEVSKGSGQTAAGALTIANGATVTCTDTNVPAIWIDGTTNDAGTVTNNSGNTTLYKDTTTKSNQIYYWTAGVAKVGEKAYRKLADAVKAAPDNTETTITMIGDDTIASYITINKKIVIDLNNHSVSADGDGFLVENGSLKLTGTGTVSLDQNDKDYYGIRLIGSADSAATGYTKLYVDKNVTVKSKGYAFSINNNVRCAYGVEADIYGRLESPYGATINGQINKTDGNVPKIHFYPGSYNNGIYAAGYAEWILEGDQIALSDGADYDGGPVSGVSIKCGTFEIKCGTYKGIGAYTDPAAGNNNGSEETGAAISITTNDGYAKKTVVTITGGTFESENGPAVYEGIALDKKGDPMATESTAVISISGGKFSAKEGMSTVVLQKAANKKVLTGGMFNKNVADYVASGYVCEELAETDPNYADGYRYIVKLPDPVAQIGEETYLTLADAVKAVPTNGTETEIKLLADCASGGITIPSGVNLTIDFNGKTVTFNKPGAGSTGTMTIGFQLLKDSTIVMKNGTIECAEENKDATWESTDLEKGIAMIIQNYADLTLDRMTIDGANIAHNGNNVRYVMSNNSGTVNIKGTTIIAESGDFAFDSCKFGSYAEPTVTVSGTSVITGKVEATGGDINFEDGTTVTGQVRIGENKTGGKTGSVVNIKAGATVNCPNDYVVVFGENTLNVYGTVNGIISTNGNDYNAGSIINIYDGANVKNTDPAFEFGNAVYMPNGELNIYGGTIEGTTAVYFKSTKLNISGGTLIGNGTKETYNYNGNGGKATGDALVIDSCNYPSGITSVAVSGGNFKSANADAVAAYNSQGAEPVTGFISGGLYSNKVDAKYIANGYVCIDNDDEDTKADYPYIVTVAPTKVDVEEEVAEVNENDSFTDDIPEANREQITADAKKEVVKDIVENASETSKSNIQEQITENTVQVKDTTETDGKKNVELSESSKTRIDVELESLAINVASQNEGAQATVLANCTVTTKTATYDVKPVVTVTTTNEETGETTVETFVITNEWLKENNKVLTFTLPVPDSMTGDSVLVKHIKEDSTEETFNARVETDEKGNRFITIVATEFSTYELSQQTEEGAVAKIENGGKTYFYSSLANAVSDAQNNDTIILLKNAPEETITVSREVTFTIKNGSFTNNATIAAGERFELEETSVDEGTQYAVLRKEGSIGGCEHEDEDKNHVCDKCLETISNHEDADKNHICDYCGKAISNHIDTDPKNHVCDYCGKTISNHVDTDPKNHVCDICGKTISNHADTDDDHKCDYCGKTISNHVDTDPKDHVCDKCHEAISNHADNDNNHICDYCGKTISNHVDINPKDHLCDICGKAISNHVDTDPKNHVCDICGKTISNHADTDDDHKCDICGEKISECEDKDKNHRCDTCGKKISDHVGVYREGLEPTYRRDGYKGYYQCKICGKYFEDRFCKREITNLAKWKEKGGRGYLPMLRKASSDPIVIGKKDAETKETNPDTGAPALDMVAGAMLLAGVALIALNKKRK